jgi:uncharacterized protein (TIGR03437 family)
MPLSFGSNTSSIALTGTGGCTASVESDSPWLSLIGSGTVSAGGVLQFRADANPGGPRTGNLILNGEGCTLSPGRQIFAVTQSGLVCDPSFASSESTLGFLPAVGTLLIRGSAPTCAWSVFSGAPWLRITSPSSGAGDGFIDFAAERNSIADLRQGRLTLNNAKSHTLYQDGAGSMLALMPEYWNLCDPSPPRFSVSWISSSGPVEIRLSSPDGTLVGRFSGSGSAVLPPNLPDRTLVYLIGAELGTPRRVLAGSRVSIRGADCTAPRINPGGIANSASFTATHLSPGSAASIFGERLSDTLAQAATTPLPEQLGSVTLTLAGVPSGLSYVSPTQINFVVPLGIAPGRHRLVVGKTTAEVLISTAAPAFFTINGRGTGTPFASVMIVPQSGDTVSTPAYSCSAQCGPLAIDLPADAREIYLILYATGLRSYTEINASLGNLPAEVLYAGPTQQFPGVDQVNLRIANPGSISGIQALRLSADGFEANLVSLLFR